VNEEGTPKVWAARRVSVKNGRTRIVDVPSTPLANTGQPARAGAYAPADKAYAELLDHHAQNHFAQMPKALADDMLNHFRDRNAALSFEDSHRKREKILAELNDFESAVHRQRVAR
jgi:hypothetical protein